MTNKERLREIKNNYLVGVHRLFGTPWVLMPKENLDWLIKQAERVHKLALDWSELVDENNELAERVEELEKEVSDWRAEVQKWQKFFQESEESHLETKELLKNIYELAEYDEYDNTLEQIVQELKKHWRRVKND